LLQGNFSRRELFATAALSDASSASEAEAPTAIMMAITAKIAFLFMIYCSFKKRKAPM
jgi:hypothetical protein